MSAPNAAIPVEAILKLALDKAGSKSIQDFMDTHEQSWGRIEQSINRIGRGVEGFGRMGLGMAGIAGVGAIVNNFMQTSQYGSNLALSAGRVTGGAGVWHPYSQGLLADQRQTGVGAGDIAQGLVQLVQSVGGNPTPQQAQILGGLLAGFGQTSGLTPAQVAQIASPLLQAANKPTSSANVAGVLGTVQAGLSAFPGSQASPMMQLIAPLALGQALGGAANPAGTAALVNAAGSSNQLWRNSSLLGGALSSVSSGLQGAYGNPSQEAFLQMAGVSYGQQRAGLNNPTTARAIINEATRMYGTGPTRDMALRSMFGLSGADLLETYGAHPGALSRGIQSAAHPGSAAEQLQQLLGQIGHAQAGTTPQARLNKAGGGILGWLESNPLDFALGIGGMLSGPALLRAATGGLGRGASSALGNLLGGGGSGVTDAGAGGSEALLEESALRILGGGATLGLGTAAGALIFPDNLNFPHGEQGNAVRKVITAAQKRFGAKAGSPAAQQWMWNQFGYRPHGQGSNMTRTAAWDDATANGENPHGATIAQQLLSRVFSQLGGGQDPITTFSQAAKQLLQAAQAMNTASRHNASYQLPGGGSQPVSYLGTSGVQSMGAIAPGMEFAALTSGTGGGGRTPVSFQGAGGATPVAFRTPSGSGGQSCLLTWYNPALGGINGGGTYADGGTYHASDMACAAPPNYPFGTKIQFSYGGKSIIVEVRDRGGAIQGTHFDLTQGAFTALAPISRGTVQATFRVVGSGSQASASRPGGASAGGSSGAGSTGFSAAIATGAAGAGVPAVVGGGSSGGAGRQVHVHNHFYVDGRKIQTSRVLLGHLT